MMVLVCFFQWDCRYKTYRWFLDKVKLNLILKKKTLFFKKKFTNKVLVSKRVTILLRKSKIRGINLLFTKRKRYFNYNGNFFFKKFFFKSLLKSRKLLKPLFSLKGKVRQKKITKKVYTYNKQRLNLVYLLLRSHLFFFINDVISAIRLGFIYVNGFVVYESSLAINQGDVIQVSISKTFYKYLYFCKMFFKTKVKLHRYNSWKFFKQKYFKKTTKARSKKRKNPNYLNFFFFYKFNLPTFLEIDYLTLTVCLLFMSFSQSNYNLFYLNKLYSFKMFALYNFKKIN